MFFAAILRATKFWVAHASRVLAMASSPSRTSPVVLKINRQVPRSSFRRDAETRSPRRPRPNHPRSAAGRGGGVGRPLGVIPGLGVSVGLAVGVAVTVAVAVGVGVDGW